MGTATTLDEPVMTTIVSLTSIVDDLILMVYSDERFESSQR